MAEIAAALAANLREPLSYFVELVRAISTQADELTGEPKLLRAAGLREEHVRLRGRPGPGGAVECDATALSFLLIAHLCDARRREVATVALELATATNHARRDRQGAKCPVTGERLFGPAFAALLSNRSMFDRVSMIRCSSDVGFAEIWFKDGSASRFSTPGGLAKPWFRERVLFLERAGLRWHLVNEREPAVAAKLPA